MSLVIDTLNHVEATQSKVSHGAVLTVAEIVRRRFFSVAEFDEETYFELLRQVDRRWWSERWLAPEDDLVHTADLALVVCEWFRKINEDTEDGRELDIEMGVMQALAHEAGEAGPKGAGDTRPSDEISPEEKIAAERRWVHAMSTECWADILVRPWEEYVAWETAEADLVEQLDKLVTVREAARRWVWREFFEYYEQKGVFTDPEIMEMARRYEQYGADLAPKKKLEPSRPKFLRFLPDWRFLRR